MEYFLNNKDYSNHVNTIYKSTLSYYTTILEEKLESYKIDTLHIFVVLTDICVLFFGLQLT